MATANINVKLQKSMKFMSGISTIGAHKTVGAVALL
jgi:hypothetical protein